MVREIGRCTCPSYTHPCESPIDPEDEKKPWTWSVPVDLWPMHLESDIKTMDKYLTDPVIPEDGTLRDLIKKVPKPRGPRRPEEWEEAGADADIDAFIAREYNTDREESSGSERDASATAIEKKQKRLEKLRKKANIPKPSRAKPAKQMKPTWNHYDFIEDSDEELAEIEAAMAREGDGEMSRQHGRPSSSSQRSSDSDVRRVAPSSPPTSPPPAARASRIAPRKKRLSAKHARSTSDEDASDAGQRHRKSNKLFLGESDDEMSDASPRKARRSPSPAGSLLSDGMPTKKRAADSSDHETRSQTKSPIKLGRSLFLGSSQDHGDLSPEKRARSVMRESVDRGGSPVQGGASLFRDREWSPAPIVAAARISPVTFGSPTSAPKQSKASDDWEERLRRQLLEEEEDENLFKDGKVATAAPIAAPNSPSPVKRTYGRVRQPSEDAPLSPLRDASEKGSVSPVAVRKRAFSFGSDAEEEKGQEEEEEHSSGKLYSEDLPSTAFVPLQLPSRQSTASPVKRPRKRRPEAPRPKMVDSGGEKDELE